MILIFLDTIHAYVFPEGKLDRPDEFYEYVLWRFREARQADRSVPTCEKLEGREG